MAKIECQMYTLYRGDEPVAYRYGPEWVSTQLFIEGGYRTEQEAIDAWEWESKHLSLPD